MAGRSRFRHGRKRSASGVITVRQEDRTPLERLAGYLETELAAKESKVEDKYPRQKYGFLLFQLPLGPRKQRHVTFKDIRKTVTFHSPPGKRHPRVSHHRGHITVSWQGDTVYHKGTWHKKIKRPSKIDYEINIFFKGSLAAPEDWKQVYEDFGGAVTGGGAVAGGAQKAWDDITSNNFVVVARNTAAPHKGGLVLWGPKPGFWARLLWLARNFTWKEFLKGLKRREPPSVAYKAGLIGDHGSSFNPALRRLARWRWFGFPGVGRERKPPGQHVDIIPGTPKPRFLGVWRRGNTASGTSMFKDEDECGLAVVTKVYPKRRKIESISIPEAVFNGISDLIRLAALIAVFVGPPVLGFLAYEGHQREQELETALENKTAENDILAGENETLTGEAEVKDAKIESLSRKVDDLRSIPRGLDHPPCWYNDNGLEFLLEVGISDAGLEIRRAPWTAPMPREWQEEFDALQFNKNLIGKTISGEDFKRKFKAVFDDTDNRNPRCRHFVRVDEGTHTDVDRYKSDRDAIESRFYIKRLQ